MDIIDNVFFFFYFFLILFKFFFEILFFFFSRCMVMYSLCCAIGGELKQDEKAMDYPSLKKMCPAGTVCCPKHSSELMDRVLDDRKRNPVPWTPNTVRLLHVLSHGKMIGAPPMESNDPAQGWLSHDPISKSGPGVCVNVQAFKDVFQTEENMSDSRTVAKEKAGDAEK